MKYKIIADANFEKIRQKIEDEKSSDSNCKIVFANDSDELNRKILERLDIDILLINLKNRRDFQKQRDSGFNQVLAKICVRSKVAIGINLDEIIFSFGEAKARILARVRQNIMLCNKEKIAMQFISPSGEKRNVYDIKALGLVLGMPTRMTKNLIF